MKENSKIFERISKIAEYYGFEGIPDLSEKLGYSSPEKLYRLNRSENAKPSFDIINDFGRAFSKLNLRWFITGKGDIEAVNTNNFASVNEESAEYKTETDKYDQIFDLLGEMIMKAIEPKLKAYDKKIQEVHDRISLKEEMEALRKDISSEKTKSKN